MNEREIFDAALAIADPDDRAAYLDRVCGDDVVRRQEIQELLEAQLRLGSFLESPPVGVGAPTLDQPFTEMLGAQIGPYKLLQQIGEGGFGVVFMAEQLEPVRRKVALKVIKPGMDTRQVIARFEAERQALAIMDHLNIARVLDAGATPSGRPYFVMELVRGTPITQYCDENMLPVRERLELFATVCRAIQHAHTKGIIHRDVKPNNVLVTRQDGQPLVKVIDFGIAKAMGQALTDKTLFTDFAQMIGTPLYMSPEQAELSATDIDTRCDIYSLGVLLYELLTGSTPVSQEQFRQAAFDEIRRIIREDDPPKPSMRISTAQAAPSIAAQRHTEIAKLSRLVRGELDWIVMKALEKDRNRRYETANGFAMDVQRYLADEPVQACPPSSGYRLRKFARRNKSPVLAASFVLLSLVVGMMGTTWAMIRAIQAEAEAQSQAQQKERALVDKGIALRAAQSSEQTAKTNETIAKEAEAEALENLADALNAVEQMLLRVGNERLANVPQMEIVRRELVGDALTVYEKLLTKHHDHPLIRLRTATANIRLANLHRLLGQHAAAESYYRTGFTLLDELKVEHLLEKDIRTLLLNAHRSFAVSLAGSERSAEAETHIRLAVELAEGLVAEFPQDARCLKDLAIANNALVHSIISDRPEEAEVIVRRNLTLTSDEVPLGRTYDHLGFLESRKGRYDEAEVAFRKALELQETVLRRNPRNSDTRSHLGSTLNQLSSCLCAVGRLSEAEKIAGRAAVVWDELAADYPATERYLLQVPKSHLNHATILERLNLPEEAANVYRRLMDLAANRAADFPDVPKYQQVAWDQSLSLGQFLLRIGHFEEAQDIFIKAESYLERLDCEASARFAHWHELLRIHNQCYFQLRTEGRKQNAQAGVRQCLAILDKLEGEYGGQAEYRGALAKVNATAGWLLHDTRQYLDEREKVARRVQSHVQAVAAQLPDDAALRSALADSHHQLGHILSGTRAEEAVVEFRQAIPLYEELARDTPEVADYRGYLAHVHNGLGRLFHRDDITAAEQEYGQALALFESLSDELPANAWPQHDRANSLEIVAVLHRNRGDLAGAKALLEQSIKYAQQACDLEPDYQAFRARLDSSRAELEKTIKSQEPESRDAEVKTQGDVPES